MSNTPGHFQYKEIDPEGFETLRIISDAVNFNNWTYEVIKPYCKGKILEIGSGIGNISDRFINNNSDITLSDIRPNYLSFLKQKYVSLLTEEKIILMDLVDPDFNNKFQNLSGTFDTVFALNVVEHIEDDVTAVKNCYKLIKPGGKIVLLMPAFQWLYNTFDAELCHFRRYNRNSMQQLLKSSELSTEKTFYFNAGGITGWFVSGKLFHNKTIPQGQMKLFDTLVPAFRLLDTLLIKKIGLSVIGVGRKPF
jgi:2-polyprenyl-3-methyl-5-hydroxy-6-metoxy-1,4-benzoquinol methylase